LKQALLKKKQNAFFESKDEKKIKSLKINIKKNKRKRFLVTNRIILVKNDLFFKIILKRISRALCVNFKEKDTHI
jgi:hypothetical protein